MSVLHTSPEAGVEPQLVRVSVLGGNTQLDVGLPATLPVAALIPDLVEQIESRTPRRHDPDDPDSEADLCHDAAHRWTLGPVGKPQLSPHRSLAESGVRDGDLLILRSIRTGDSPVLFDDVVDAVARLNESRFANWSAAAARHTGYGIAIVAAVVAAVSLGAVRRTDGAIWVALPGGVAGIGLLTAATIVARHRRDDACSLVITATALPFCFVAGMLAAPGPFGAAHLALGCATTLLAVVLSYRLTGVGPVLHSAVTTAVILGGSACAIRMLSSLAVPQTAALVAAVGLLVIALAPRVTILLAKLPLPPVPTAGAPLDADELEPRPTIEGIGAIGAVALPKVDALERRSFTANSYLTGMVAGATAITATSAVITADSWAGISGRAVVYALIVGAVLCLRGRSHSDLAQAATMIIGGALSVITVTGASAVNGGAWPIAAFAIGVGIVVAALLLGVVAPEVEFSPVVRRAAELVEYGLVALIVPLLLWLLDLYRIVREI